MKKLLTKKNALIIASVGTLLFLIFIFSRYVYLCNEFDWSCSGKYDDFAEILQIFIPLFFFSLITYKLPDQVFRSWFNHFALWWIPLSMFLTFITPHSGGGLGLGISTGPGDTSFVLSFLFVIISLIIILVSYIRNRKSRQIGGK